MVNPSCLFLDGGQIVIKNRGDYSSEELAFLEIYWNECSWGNSGSRDSAAFIKFILSLDETIKQRLLGHGFVDASLLAYGSDNDSLFQRFIGERVVRFEGQGVLAPVWELVNHDSFAPPLRTTCQGVETPPMVPGPNEILFKYSGSNSPIGMWKKYGFACDCIVAYSVPFNIAIGSQGLAVKCSGQLGLGPNEKTSFTIIGNALSIKSLPIGCLSIELPLENFKAILSAVGLSGEIANKIFLKIREENLKARRDLISSFCGPVAGAQAQYTKH